MSVKPTLPSLSQMLGKKNCIHCGKKVGTCQCKDFQKNEPKIQFTKGTLMRALAMY